MEKYSEIEVFSTEIKNRKKTKVKLVIENRRGYLNQSNIDDKKPGDVLLATGTIRYVFKKVPECFFREDKTGSATVLSLY